jgi:hypothetical protein
MALKLFRPTIAAAEVFELHAEHSKLTFNARSLAVQGVCQLSDRSIFLLTVFYDFCI